MVGFIGTYNAAQHTALDHGADRTDVTHTH